MPQYPFYHTLDQLYAAQDGMGYDEDIVGAAPPVMALQGGYAAPVPRGTMSYPYQGPARTPLAMRSAFPAMGLAPARPPVLRRVPLGVDSGPVLIAAGATVEIEQTPQVKFRPERLTVTDTIADFFLINDIKVGKDSMLPSTDPITASVFKSAATDVQLAFKTCQIGQKIVISVTNVDVAAHRFTAAFLGATAEQ